MSDFNILVGTDPAPSSIGVMTQVLEIPALVRLTFPFTAGDIPTFEMARDTDGNDSGGLRAGIPTMPGWNDAPSAKVSIIRILTQTIP